MLYCKLRWPGAVVAEGTLNADAIFASAIFLIFPYRKRNRSPEQAPHAVRKETPSDPTKAFARPGPELTEP